MSDEGRYVVLTVSEGCDPVNRLYICDLQKIDYQITGERYWNCLVLKCHLLSRQLNDSQASVFSENSHWMTFVNQYLNCFILIFL